MHKFKSVFLVVLLLFTLTSAVFATVDNDLFNGIINDVKEAALQLAQQTGLVAEDVFENKANQFRQDITSYVQQVKNEILAELKSYADSLVAEKTKDLDDTKEAIKEQIDGQKNQITNGAKEQIKADVDAKYEKAKQKLINDVKNDLKNLR